MNAEEWVRSWFEKAEHDAEAAHRALEDEPLPDIACFHAQQCTEKCLKGFLTAHEQVVEKTHDLTDLLEKCAAINASFEQWADACERLSGYAVVLRYPGPERTGC